ncbi:MULTISPECIES: hypothetical protein [unclassified Wolbachia]|nr:MULTISPECIES: hypothetical protein [unclassified Wolbachia]
MFVQLWNESRYDVESALAITQHFYTHQISLLAYKQTFLNPSSQATRMTPL